VTFIWPAALALLLIVPLEVAAAASMGRRRARRAAAYGGFGLRPADGHSASRRARVRRRVGPALALLGLAAVLLAAARPQAALSLPRLEGTVVLAFDVSRSMAATDFGPTRMEAAKAAARAFVEKQPPTVQIGVVAFSDSGLAVQQATSDQAQVLAAIDRLTPQRGTSLAQGIQASLAAIATAEDPTAGYYTNRSPAPAPSPVPPGTHRSAVVVLLSDGENNERPDPAAAAQAAADRGIRIHTVGIGTPGGTDLTIDGFAVHTALDEAVLRSIADTTGGTYYAAPDQAHLDAVYDTLDTNLVVKAQPTEITAAVAGVGALALLAGCLASLAWLGRLP
jgi:Ca-activated chloride channel family protein